MLMRDCCIHTQEGDIPVRVARHGGTTLLECLEPESFLARIAPESEQALSPGLYVRGVVIPEEGAVFDLCDQFGTVAREFVHLDQEKASQLLVGLVC